MIRIQKYANQPIATWFLWLLTVVLSFRYWALAVPSFVMVAVALSMVIYMGFNFLATPPPTSFDTIFGETETDSLLVMHSSSVLMNCCFASSALASFLCLETLYT